jgi:hypothetical protein
MGAASGSSATARAMSSSVSRSIASQSVSPGGSDQSSSTEIRVIPTSFLARCRPCRNDSAFDKDDGDFTFALSANGDPPVFGFTIFTPGENLTLEDLDRVPEVDAVFAAIADCFFIVPLEARKFEFRDAARLVYRCPQGARLTSGQMGNNHIFPQVIVYTIAYIEATVNCVDFGRI